MEKEILIELPISGKKFPVLFRESGRAKRLVIYFKRDHGELVTPVGYPEESAHLFLLNHRLWLEGQLRKRALLPEKPPAAPLYVQELIFPAFSEKWQIHYRFRKSGKLQSFFLEEEHTCLLSGEVLERELIKKALKEFLIKEAKRLLPPRFAQIAQRIDLPYNSLQIKYQKSRWGCCNSRRDIILNAALLLVPEKCVEYVMLHELCHTLSMDHSERFYAHLAGYMPEYELYREQLKKILLPEWQ